MIVTGPYDYDLVNTAYLLAVWAQDWPLAIQFLQVRNIEWTAQAADGWLKIGNILAPATDLKDEAKALTAYSEALAIAPEVGKGSVWAQIPAVYLPRL